MTVEALRHAGIPVVGARAAVQGLGEVGRGAARFRAEEGVAVDDVHGAICDPAGLDVDAVEMPVDRTGSVVGFPGAQGITGADLLAAEVDLLVPAAVEGVVHAGNAEAVRARVVVEGANGPLTAEADRVQEARGVLVVPDVLANAGGVVVSYSEWVQATRSYWESEEGVSDRLVERMTRPWRDVPAYAVERRLSLRLAVTCTAVQRVHRAHEVRGLHP